MRTNLIVAITAVMAAAVLSGCGASDKSGSGGLTALPAGSSPAVTPSASTSDTGGGSTTATGGGGGGGGTTPAPPSYSTTAKAYSQQTLTAYGKGQSTALGRLTGPGGKVDFANLGNPDKHWHYHACAPDGTNTACAYDNDNGDRLTMDIDPTLLGKPHAVTSAFIDRTDFGSTPDNAVGALVQAWSDGNKYRMIALSDASTAQTLLADTAPPSWMLLDDTTTKPGHVIVTISNSATSDYEIDVNPAKLGHPHAMTMLLGD